MLKNKKQPSDERLLFSSKGFRGVGIIFHLRVSASFFELESSFRFGSRWVDSSAGRLLFMEKGKFGIISAFLFFSVFLTVLSYNAI